MLCFNPLSCFPVIDFLGMFSRALSHISGYLSVLVTYCMWEQYMTSKGPQLYLHFSSVSLPTLLLLLTLWFLTLLSSRGRLWDTTETAWHHKQALPQTRAGGHTCPEPMASKDLSWNRQKLTLRSSWCVLSVWGLKLREQQGPKHCSSLNSDKWDWGRHTDIFRLWGSVFVHLLLIFCMCLLLYVRIRVIVQYHTCLILVIQHITLTCRSMIYIFTNVLNITCFTQTLQNITYITWLVITIQEHHAIAYY